MNNRILFLTPGLGKGGAETQMIKIARFFKLQGIDVLVISLKHINDFSPELKNEGLKIIFLKRNWLLNFLPNLYTLVKTIRSYKPDVVIAFMFIAIIFGRLLKKLFNFKLVSSIRQFKVNRKWAGLLKLTSGLDDAVVYNSEASKLNFEQLKLAKEGGSVIKNAITIPVIENLPSQKNDSFKWISIAHFRITKDYPTLFKAISLLKEHDFKVDIVGHVNDLEWPAKTIEELGIRNYVTLLGFQDDSSVFIKNSDALVLSSFSEGMPNAILEAMAHAKPVVASDIDGVNELINDSEGGLLFRAGDAVDLAAKMLTMMEVQQEKREAMGMAGRQFIENNFEEKLIFNEWLKYITPYLEQNK